MVVNSVVSLYYYLAVPKQMLFVEAEHERPIVAPALVTAVAVLASGGRGGRGLAELLAHFTAVYPGRAEPERAPRATLRAAAPANPVRGRRMERDKEVPLIGLNRVKTWILIAALGGLFVLIGAWFGVPAIVALAIALVFNFSMYWFSDRIATATTRSKPVTEQEAPELYRIVRELTQINQMACRGSTSRT